MPHYLLLVQHDYSKPIYASDAERDASFAATGRFNQSVIDAGEFVYAGGLEEPDTAKVVDATRGDAVTKDGPLAEADFRLGGFWILDLPDLETALARAAASSAACGAPVEVRAFHSM